MRPSARLQAIIEVLDEILSGWNDAADTPSLPADLIVKRYTKNRRYIGSKDRRYINDTAFSILRNYGTLSWHIQQHRSSINSRNLAVAHRLLIQENELETVHELFDGDKYSPTPLTQEEEVLAEALSVTTLYPNAIPEWAKLNYPEWLEPSLKKSLGDTFEQVMLEMQNEAPLCLRANTLKTTRVEAIAALQKQGVEASSTAISPLGIKLKKRINLDAILAFKKGYVEVQDEHSQLISVLSHVKPGETVVDYCAGAGGKTLALAAAMQNQGSIIACDTDEQRLQQLVPRARRAGASNITPCLLGRDDAILDKVKGKVDCVLVDAPCSGSGVWRRQPDARWYMNRSMLNRYIELQREVLNNAIPLLSPGGRLLYVTCSLLSEENEAHIEWLEENHPKLELVSPAKIWNKLPIVDNAICGSEAIRLLPYKAGGDGFFAAMLANQAVMADNNLAN